MNKFPNNYLKWYNKIYGIATPLKNANHFILYTDYNYILIDMTKDIPLNSTIVSYKEEKSRNADWNKKIKSYHKAILDENYKHISNIQKDIIFNENQENDDNNNNFKIISRYSSILFMDYIDDDKILVIENDWNKILKHYPDSVYKPVYGS